MTVQVVDHEEHVLRLDVAKVLGHAHRRQSDEGPCAGRLLHLGEDHRGAIEHAASLHFLPQFEPFPRSFTDAGEHGDAFEPVDHVVDELGEDDRLPDAGAAEHRGASTRQERAEEVDDLDAGRVDHPLGGPVLGRRRPAVDWRHGSRHRAAVVDGPALQVDDATEQRRPRRDAEM